MSKDRRMGTRPRGEGKPWKAALLEQGASLLQDNTPVKQFDIYMVGFHCGRHDSAMQMEAHHYCRQVNGEFFQCVIFDGNTRDANLIGIEYIISERLFDELAPEEQARWHPHNFEVFSGELVAPGLPDAAETAMLKFLAHLDDQQPQPYRARPRPAPGRATADVVLQPLRRTGRGDEERAQPCLRHRRGEETA